MFSNSRAYGAAHSLSAFPIVSKIMISITKRCNGYIIDRTRCTKQGKAVVAAAFGAACRDNGHSAFPFLQAKQETVPGRLGRASYNLFYLARRIRFIVSPLPVGLAPPPQHRSARFQLSVFQSDFDHYDERHNRRVRFRWLLCPLSARTNAFG